jgi:hypothetical protein
VLPVLVVLNINSTREKKGEREREGGREIE